ncbi:hypothetical protein [uncultured Caulobacter sp.]|uniref:hypothetical protein n=1 Tax=uncultured Caulobacter sp. TaxID=158749 RepID=UPI002603322F|nr:hypothetical protein [uncultured Caulobacter sp.]
MTRLVIVSLAIGAIALPTAITPTRADAASCHSRKATGTVIGGLGGALVGNAISKGGGGLLVGGLGGALIGREIGKSGCHTTRTVYYEGGSRAPARRPAPEPARQVYYDQRGNRIAADGFAPAAQPVSNPSGGCRAATISFYDERGQLVRRNVDICPR